MPDIRNYGAEDLLADESFVNYLLQKNEADIILWKHRIAANELNAAELMRAKQLFFAIKQEFKAADKTASLQQLQQLIENEDKEAVAVHYLPAAKRTTFTAFWKIAAAAVIILFCAGIWKYETISNKNAIAAQNAFTVFAKAADNMYTAVLPDGSQVMLNKYSSISINENFNTNKREVVLNGTAFFEVTKNPEKPFTVISGDVHTTALGTSFYIHQSSNGKPTTVSLLTGKVRIDEKGQASINLVPYEKAVCNISQSLVKETFDETQLLNWTKGMIHFEKAGLNQVINVLEEYFDKKIVTEGTLKDISFTGEFKSNELSSILESLQFTYDLKYNINGNIVTITF